MTENLKIEVSMVDVEGGLVDTSLATKEELTTAVQSKADLIEGKIPAAQLPNFDQINGVSEAINGVETKLRNEVATALGNSNNGLESRIDKKLEKKADLVNGRVPASQSPAFKDVEGAKGALDGLKEALTTKYDQKVKELSEGKADLVDGKIQASQLPTDAIVTPLDFQLKSQELDTKFSNLEDSVEAEKNAFIGQVGNLISGKANVVDVYSKVAVDNKLDGKVDNVKYNGDMAKKADRTYVDAGLTAVAAGHKAYTTLALAQSAKASLPANTIVEVTNDPTSSNNGTYQWNGTTLTKSAYDPLTQAKNYTDEKVSENNPNLLGVMLTGLTSKNLDASEAKYKILFLSGTLGGDCTVNFPKQRGIWEVRHQATGGDILLKTLDSSLTPIRISNGQLVTVLSDGTNLLVTNNHKVNANGGVLTNATANTPSAATTLGVATVQFANRVSGAAIYVGLTGDKILTIDEQAYKTIICTGALSADTVLEFPVGSGHWVVSNQTTGGKSLILKCTGQSSTPITLDDNGYYEVMAAGSVIRFVRTEKQTRSAIISLTGLTEKTLSAAEAKKEILFFGGTLTQDITVNFPKQAGQWVVRHQGTAGFKIALKTLDSAAIAPVSLTNGQTVNVVSDGANLHVVDIQNRTGEHKGAFEVKATYYQNDIVEHGSGTYKVTAQQVFNAKNPMTSKSFAKISTRPINNKKIAARSVDMVDLATTKEVDGMSKDGMTLYSRSPWYSLFASKDFGATWNPIFTINGGEFGNIVEELDNGELLLSYSVYGAEPRMRKIYVTDGYDFGRGASPTLVEVLSSTREKNYWNNNWGCDIYGNIILLTEYGRKYDPAKTPDGSWTNVQGENARYVWMSTDFGKTWTVIFDLNSVTSGIGVHMHSAVYDYVWNRIWVHFGDAAFNRNGMLYSDDLGKTWTWALQTNAPYINWNQSTSTVVLPDCILFGSDSAPNGIYRLDRSQGKNPINGYYEVEVAYKIPDTSDTLLNSVCYKAVQAKHSPDQPYLFGFAPESMPSKGCIVATYDGYTFFEIWRDSEVRSTGYGIRQLIGVTPQNEIIATNFDQRYGAGTKTQLRIKV